MEIVLLIVGLVAGTAAGVGAGFMIRSRALARDAGAAAATAERATAQAEKVAAQAEEEKKRILLEAKEEALQARREAENDVRERRREQQRAEARVATKEEALERRLQGVDRKEAALVDREKEVETTKAQAEDLKAQQAKMLETVAALTMAEAKDQIMQKAEGGMQHDLAKRYYELERQMLTDADNKAKRIITLAVQRLAADVVSETTTSQVPLPNDEMKGRLIGREGRNIRAIEAATGVDLIVDDTPEAVTISCFDPIRREVARIALGALIQDGRIHPARVEEAVAKAQKEVEESIARAGEQGVLDAGVRGLHPELIKLVGRLKFRYSYGENVLAHSVEVAQIAGLLAGELKANTQVAKAAGLLHDIGKAMTHEVEGSHIEIGDEIAKRFGLSEPVKAAIAEHHDDERGSVEAFIVAAADAISAARPGARRDTVEFYLKRLEALEDVANSFPGVQKSFAIQAGREVRILVEPTLVDDVEAASLARNVVKKIEENLVYPGEIKVTVVRETRISEYAK